MSAKGRRNIFDSDDDDDDRDGDGDGADSHENAHDACDGYDKDGYDKDGYDKDGYDKDGYDLKGCDRDNYDREGYHYYKAIARDGYDRYGFDIKGFNKQGFNIKGLNAAGYDIDGYDERGFNRDGYNRGGFFDRERKYSQKLKYATTQSTSSDTPEQTHALIDVKGYSIYSGYSATDPYMYEDGYYHMFGSISVTKNNIGIDGINQTTRRCIHDIPVYHTRVRGGRYHRCNLCKLTYEE